MARTVLEWHAKEYEFEEKSADWYWAVGIVAAGLGVACILFGNVLLALVIVAAAAAIALESAKHPKIHRFALSDAGLAIDDAFHPFEDMLGFSLIEYLDETTPPALSLKTRSIFASHLLIPLAGVNADAVFEYMLARVPHDAHDLPLPARLAALFRF